MPEYLQGDPVEHGTGRSDSEIGSISGASDPGSRELTTHRLKAVADDMMHLSEQLAQAATQMRNILAVVNLTGGQGFSDAGSQAMSNPSSKESSQAGDGVRFEDVAKLALLRRLGMNE